MQESVEEQKEEDQKDPNLQNQLMESSENIVLLFRRIFLNGIHIGHARQKKQQRHIKFPDVLKRIRERSMCGKQQKQCDCPQKICSPVSVGSSHACVFRFRMISQIRSTSSRERSAYSGSVSTLWLICRAIGVSSGLYCPR